MDDTIDKIVAKITLDQYTDLLNYHHYVHRNSKQLNFGSQINELRTHYINKYDIENGNFFEHYGYFMSILCNRSGYVFPKIDGGQE